MSNKVYPNGSAIIEIASGDKLAVFSAADVKIYTRTRFTPSPSMWDLLTTALANEEYVSDAFSAKTEVKIDAGASEALYQVGTSANVLERKGSRVQEAPGILNATGAVTADMITSGIVTSTTAAAVAGTVPTGAVLDAAVEMEIDESFDWSVIATGANAFTVTAAASGHTLVGAAAVATGTSGLFRTRKTAAATFVTYRIG